MTGLTFIPDEVNGRRLQLLKEIFPECVPGGRSVVWAESRHDACRP